MGFIKGTEIAYAECMRNYLRNMQNPCNEICMIGCTHDTLIHKAICINLHLNFCTFCRGDSKVVQSNGIHAFLWRDNRVVTILSTSAQPHELGMVQRREHNGTRVNVQCPAALAHYQAFMGGVDKNHQLRQYYHVRLKRRKFYKYIFWFTFEAAIVKSYILHTHYSSRARQPLKEFQLQLAKGLVGEYHSKKRHNRHHAPPHTYPSNIFHQRSSEMNQLVQ